MALDDHLVGKLQTLSTSDKLAAMQILLGMDQNSKKKHKITELRGLGKEIWNLDPQQYIDEERSSWQ